ncbi:hypothetical protein, partial [Nocardia cyriacigeorgica]|uniref:hypothetical protein n=1 Tax=Nocardia cyriacigeorgica TaxID=135487 RepID=UPI0024563F6D
AGNLRPGLADPKPADVGFRLGTSKGTGVWASVEDSIMVIGPPPAPPPPNPPALVPPRPQIPPPPPPPPGGPAGARLPGARQAAATRGNPWHLVAGGQ